MHLQKCILLALFLALVFGSHISMHRHLQHRHHHNLTAQFETKPECIKNDGLIDELKKQQDLNKNLTDIYSLGKIPGNCNPAGISVQQKVKFLLNAHQIKDKILTTRATLLAAGDQKKQTAEDLQKFQQKFVDCLKSLDPNSTIIKLLDRKHSQQKQDESSEQNRKQIKKTQTKTTTTATISTPATVSVVPIVATATSLPIRPKKLVSNPLAKNIIIEDRGKVVQQMKQRLDDNTTDYDACPIQKPFFNGKQCIQCKDYFNVNTNICTTCPGNTKYNAELLRCIKNRYLTNLNAEGLLLRDKKLEDWKDIQSKLKSSSPQSFVECPLEKPYASNGQCISCESKVFDLSNQRCFSCGLNQKYNKQTRQCEDSKSSSAFVSPRLVAPLAPTIPIPLTSTSSDTTSKVVSVVDVADGPIVNTSQKYLINPETYGLIIDVGSVDQYVAKYKALKNNPSGGHEDCGPSTPYFDGKSCIACQGLDSKFRLSTRKCTRCPDGTLYVYALKQCVIH